jgi:hypothetical protein
MKLKETAVNHIVLDSQDEAVKRFFLSLPDDSQGSVVELNGRALACVLPPPKATNGTTEEWSDAKNNRRGDLIDREFDGPPLTPAEVVELAGLQEEMLRHRQRVAPIPIEDARRLHQELLARVTAQESGQ